MLHRDIKPENLLVGHNGQIKVADFGLGLAEGQSKLTRTGTTVGSPLYMSPEQIRGERDALTPASDVWSLAVSLYEVLTGLYPIPGETATSLIAGHLFRPPIPFDESDPEGPSLFLGLVL